MTDRAALATAYFDALNVRDLDTAALLLHPDVDWQDGFNGGRQHGRAAMRAFWDQVFDHITTTTSVLEMKAEGDDRLVVVALLSVHSLAGKSWGEGLLTFAFTFRDGLISRMDLRGPT